MLKEVIKRDNRKVCFDKKKITAAIFKAAREVGGDDTELAKALTEIVADMVEKAEGAAITVEEIQDIVEKTLIEEGHAKTAKAYILYRYERSKAREQKMRLIQTVAELSSNETNSNNKRENANIVFYII
jgi:ribonucleoside-triphosphate reductase